MVVRNLDELHLEMYAYVHMRAFGKAFGSRSRGQKVPPAGTKSEPRERGTRG